MFENVDKFLLTWDKCIPEMHVGQHGFTYAPSWPFTKNRERTQFKETGD